MSTKGVDLKYLNFNEKNREKIIRWYGSELSYNGNLLGRDEWVYLFK